MSIRLNHALLNGVLCEFGNMYVWVLWYGFYRVKSPKINRYIYIERESDIYREKCVGIAIQIKWILAKHKWELRILSKQTIPSFINYIHDHFKRKTNTTFHFCDQYKYMSVCRVFGRSVQLWKLGKVGEQIIMYANSVYVAVCMCDKTHRLNYKPAW